MSDVKRCPCRGSNDMCGCQNGPHPVRQDPEDEINALRARLAEVEKDRDQLAKRVQNSIDIHNRKAWQAAARAERAEAQLATARRDAYERAAQVADAHLDRLPNYTCPDNECADQVEQGYGNACINIAHSIRALANEAET